MKSPQDRIKELYPLIRKYDAAYYGRGESLIPDKEYDELYHELVELETNLSNLVEPDSPTRRIGDDLTREFTKVEHSTPMMSIDNTYSEEELLEWIERTGKNIGTDDITFIGELKIDGVACAIRYVNGKLTQAITRGNGTIGDDITSNVRTIRSLPLIVEYQGSFEIRGEIYMTFENFQRLNESLTENGQQPMQNPRNTTAGTVKLLDPREVAKRRLSFATHFLLSESHIQNHSDNLTFLEQQGFPTVIHSEPLISAEKVIQFCNAWNEKRSTVAYPVDGVVIKVNNMQQQTSLGATAKSPRWIIAYKYQPETAETEVLSIDAQVGRTGVITPVARLQPVLLSGSTIRNATLHNYDEIARLDIQVGDIVEIEKSGEIIPKVIRVVSRDKRTADTSFTPPDTCPSCQSSLIRIEGEVALRCINTSCPAQIFASLNHFVSREAMNIEGLGPAIIEQLIATNLVSTPADLFTLSVEPLADLERMGSKSATNALSAITNAKKNPLHRLIHGLGIRMIGAQSAKILASSVDDILDLAAMTLEELTELDTIGPNMAASVTLYFQQEKNRELINRLRAAGVNCHGEKALKSETPLPLSGKTYVLTGSLERFARDQARECIETLGGKVSSSVSKKTTAVIAGTDPGSKYTKAQKLGIMIMDEPAFLDMLHTHGIDLLHNFSK